MTSRQFKAGLAAVLILSLNGAALAVEPPRPRKVVILLGDGLGLNQIWLSQLAGPGVQGRLRLQSLPVTGLMTTTSQSGLVTDSAAAATALATGHTTANGRIGQLPDGTRLKNLMEAAREQGLALGVVVTKNVTDATPAGFTAHNSSRANEAAIAQDLLKLRPEVVLGGGRNWWLPRSAGGRRADGRNLLSEAREQGYRVVSNAAELAGVTQAPLLGLLAEDRLDQNDPATPGLKDLSAKALSLLDQDPDGFVLLIEGSQIDTRAHHHDRAGLVARVRDFDEAVGTAVDFARRDCQTLVIVLADHETGGLTVLNGGIRWSTRWHSSAPVPLGAYGPGAANFSGWHANTALAGIVGRLLGLKDFPAAPADAAK